MRPRVFTLRNVVLLTCALLIFGGMAYWLSIGAPLPFGQVPSTAGKVVFVSDRDGQKHLWMMDGATGANPVALTTGKSSDRQPTWSANGSEIAFISENRAGVTPQVFRTDAKAGSNAIPVSNTSATKEQPVYGPEGRIFYLASGKLTATTPSTQDTDQVFPIADATRTVAPLLSTGGIARAAVSPDGKLIAAALRMEQGEALVIYDVQGQICNALGAAADKVLFHFLPDGKLIAVFVDGAPLPKPVTLFDADKIKGQLPAFGPLILASVQDTQIILQVGEGDDPNAVPKIPVQKARVAVEFDTSGAATQALPIPFRPNSIAISPDSSTILMAVDEPTKLPQGTVPPGLWKLPLGGAQSPADKPFLFTGAAAYDPSFSPDGKQVVFTSGKDIYVVPADGSGDAKNLTQGKGENSQPVWSPTKPEAK